MDIYVYTCIWNKKYILCAQRVHFLKSLQRQGHDSASVPDGAYHLNFFYLHNMCYI